LIEAQKCPNYGGQDVCIPFIRQADFDGLTVGRLDLELLAVTKHGHKFLDEFLVLFHQNII
jgi:hypothetical protein